MPRPRNTTPTYRHHRPSNRAVVTLNGRDMYLPGAWKSPESRAEYRRILAELHAGGRAAAPTPPSQQPAGLTIVELIAQYVTFCRGYYAESATETDRVVRALSPLKRLYGRQPAASFGPLALKAARHAMVDVGLSRATVNAQVQRIKRLFGWGVQNEIVPATVSHALREVPGLRRGRTMARDAQRVGPVPDHRVDAVLSHVSLVVADMIRLQRVTGMRSGELVIMRGGDLDMSGKVWQYTPAKHKAELHGIDRTIWFGPQAQAIVTPYLKPDLSAYLFSPAESEEARNATKRAGRKTPMTPSQGVRGERAKRRRRGRAPGNRYDVASYRRAIVRGCEKAWPFPSAARLREVEKAVKASAEPTADLIAERDRLRTEQSAWRQEHDWFPHQLRHSAATRLRKEFGLEAARVILGHQSPAITQIYAEVDMTKARDIAALVG